MIKIKKDEFKLFSQYIYKISGILLEENKAYLLETRLARLVEEQNCTSFSELHRRAIFDGKKTLERKIIDAVTTNETYFYRDTSPFEMLQYKILPDLIDRRMANSFNGSRIPIRIWSAACSTGQEIYSIAMVLKDTLDDFSKCNIKLFGTDISTAAIAKASYGEYSQLEVERGLEHTKLEKYFYPNENKWRIKDEIRSLADFKHFNLNDPFSSFGRFDIVFCRNIGIYFGVEDRKKLFNKIAGVMEKDGYLIIGSSESLTGVSSRFQLKQHLKSMFYQLVD